MKQRGKQSGKKDFVKQSRRVGVRKTQSNETKASGVRSRRVVMPVQQLTANNDTITDCLIGLRHYNDKKRLDAVNALLRVGHANIPEERVGEIVTSLGFGISDEDESVRSKCCALLYTLLSEFDESVLEPFYSRICIHIRAALANVKPGIRFDGVQFLHRVVPFGIFSTGEVVELVKSLVELNSAILPSQSARGSSKGPTQDVRKLIWKSVEGLLEHVVSGREEVEQGYMNPNEWTIGAIVSRTFAQNVSISGDIRKLLTSLTRQGEDATRERIEELALSCEFLDRPKISEHQEEQARRKKKASSGSVFSKLSMLTRDDSD